MRLYSRPNKQLKKCPQSAKVSALYILLILLAKHAILIVKDCAIFQNKGEGGEFMSIFYIFRCELCGRHIVVRFNKLQRDANGRPMKTWQQPCLNCFVKGVTEDEKSPFTDTGKRIASNGKKIEIFFPGALN